MPRRTSYMRLALADPKAHEGADGEDAVAPGDLLALFVRAAVVGDRHLVQARAAAQDLRRDLRLEAEVVGDEGDRAHESAAERLVADLHVADRRVEQHVG